MTGALHSALYVGRLRHRRYRPRPHTFAYRLFMTYLDLDELPELFARRWLRRCARAGVIGFRRGDYLGDPGQPLPDAVRARVAEQIGRRPSGPIRMLTHLRQFGVSFNPVSFYYCFDQAGGLDAVAAQITNTPWNERHTYVLDAADNRGDPERWRHRFRKTFHVSPFIGMDCDYEWRLTVPRRTLVVHMENHAAGELLFDATLSLRRRELSRGSLARTLLAHPFLPARVLSRIYLQAARLWMKRTPFFAHPEHGVLASGESAGSGRPSEQTGDVESES
jgi:DUF1365 family protein